MCRFPHLLFASMRTVAVAEAEAIYSVYGDGVSIIGKLRVFEIDGSFSLKVEL